MSGYNIAGPEVENALLEHPAVAECGVVGLDDEQRGQVLQAFVVLRPGFEASTALVKELQYFVKTAIAPYKYPRAIEFIAALPTPRPASCSASDCAKRHFKSRQRNLVRLDKQDSRHRRSA